MHACIHTYRDTYIHRYIRRFQRKALNRKAEAAENRERIQSLKRSRENLTLRKKTHVSAWKSRESRQIGSELGAWWSQSTRFTRDCDERDITRKAARACLLCCLSPQIKKNDRPLKIREPRVAKSCLLLSSNVRRRIGISPLHPRTDQVLSLWSNQSIHANTRRTADRSVDWFSSYLVL